jgi:hypothetical protein
MVSVALCGAGGVGKGTLGNQLAHELGYYFLPSKIQNIGQRIYPQADGFKGIPAREKFAYQHSILTAQIEKELLLRDVGINFVSERSVLDYLPYFMKAFSDDLEAVKHYKKMIMDHVYKMSYTYLIYLPVEFRPTKEDLAINNWKERDPDSQNHTDAVIFDLVKETEKQKLSTIIMPSGNVERRTAECLAEIKL